jgi:translation initiation factor IF-1
MVTQPHVGTLREKPLHAALKQWYAEPGDAFEVALDRFVIDIVRGDLLIEIQTRGFSSMRRKLAALLDEHPVRIVHPIAATRRIVKVDDAGTVVSRRVSPKHGTVVDLFPELVSFPRLVAHPNLTLDVLLVDEEEVRCHVPGKAWRRQGWVVEEHRLLVVHERVRVSTPDDVASMLPATVPDEFTTSDLAAALGRPLRLAQQMAFCLRTLDLVAPVGKRGNSVIYRRCL